MLTRHISENLALDSIKEFKRDKSLNLRDQRGFTLVELNLSLLVLGFIMVSILGVTTNFLVTITRNNVTADMALDSQSLLRTLVEEIRYGAGIRQTNTIADPNSPVGGWNTSNTAFIIITAVPATNSSNDYIIDEDTGKPYLNELVYYKQGRTIYKRTLANTAATDNKLKTSCPQASASATCPADKKLVENVDSMAFLLYDQDNATTTNALLARSIKIDISLSKETFGQPISANNSIRSTLRNTY